MCSALFSSSGIINIQDQLQCLNLHCFAPTAAMKCRAGPKETSNVAAVATDSASRACATGDETFVADWYQEKLRKFCAMAF